MKNIVYEASSKYWVLKTKNSYSVMINVGTHSINESDYSLNDDGLSIAIRRCDYLANREV